MENTENTLKQAFIENLASFQKSEEKVNDQKTVNDQVKTELKNAGAMLAESLYMAILAEEINEAFMENLPKLSRVCQSYVSKAKKVAFAVKAKSFTLPPSTSIITAYDQLQKAEKAKKEVQGNIMAQASQNAAREYAALLEVFGNDAEISRALNAKDEKGNPDLMEYKTGLATGLAIIAEQEAQALAEEKAADMEKLVTETKANLAIIMDSPYWQEMLDYVNQSTNSHKSASAA